MNLTAGEQIMRFTVIEDPSYNIDKIIFESPNSLEYPEPDNFFFTVYQNQSRELVFNFNNDIPARLVQVYDITGSLILSITDPDKDLKISAFGKQTGIYFIQALTDRQKFSKKIIIY
jgi:hypothetical protein